jgi:parvulin-like peptidyl-prolyl isomerase
LLKKWLGEPLLHFLLIGAVLFFIYGIQNEGFVDDNKRIVISEADINRLIMLWGKKQLRPPTQAELDGLIEQQIREEVMYREALAMGLDQNDSIVRRRLAQKVEFISADLAALVEPTDEELADYLATHTDKFEVPARMSFVQLYFNTDKRGAQAEKDVLRLLDELKQTDSKVDIKIAGDPFMMGQQHDHITEYGVSRLFGKDFSKKLFTLPTGDWQGPVSSGYGLHLVRIDDKTVAQQPELKAVRDKVRNEWLAQQRRIVNKSFYQSLRQRYEIVIKNVVLNDVVAITKQ